MVIESWEWLTLISECVIQEPEGILPGMFKALIGKGHPEFSTMRQQVRRHKDRVLYLDMFLVLYFISGCPVVFPPSTGHHRQAAACIPRVLAILRTASSSSWRTGFSVWHPARFRTLTVTTSSSGSGHKQRYSIWRCRTCVCIT